MKLLLTQQDQDFFDISVVQDRKRREILEERPSHQLADGEWDKLAHRMIGELVTSKQLVFKCSNILKAGALMQSILLNFTVKIPEQEDR